MARMRISGGPPIVCAVGGDRDEGVALLRTLHDGGLRVVACADTAAARRRIALQQPDLLLLDADLPGEPAIEFAAECRERSGLSSVFVSACGDPASVARASAAGALGYLVRPLDHAQILPTVRTALALSGDLRSLREQHRNMQIKLAGRQQISTAVGVMMERMKLSHEEAYARLRSRARSERRRLDDVALELLRTTSASRDQPPRAHE